LSLTKRKKKKRKKGGKTTDEKSALPRKKRNGKKSHSTSEHKGWRLSNEKKERSRQKERSLKKKKYKTCPWLTDRLSSNCGKKKRETDERENLGKGKKGKEDQTRCCESIQKTSRYCRKEKEKKEKRS